MAFYDFLREADAAASASELMAPPGSALDPDDLRAIWPKYEGDDYEDALAMLETARPAYGDLEGCYRMAIGRVRLGLGGWWEEIEAVAEALMQKERLSGAEAVAVIEGRRLRRNGEQREGGPSAGGPESRTDSP